jgi:hypothetical protein
MLTMGYLMGAKYIPRESGVIQNGIMDKFKITMWTVVVQVFVLFFTMLGGLVDTMNEAIIQVGLCPSGDAICILFTYGRVFISFLVAAVVFDLSKQYSLYQRVLDFFTIPNHKALQISSGKLRDKIFTLKFKNTEWRYLLHKTNAFATVPSMARITILENLEWSSTRKTEPIFINRFRSYELNFVEVDAKRNKFSVITNGDKKVSFGIGEYGFDVCSYANIFRKFKVEGNKLVDSIGYKSAFNEQYIIVDYKGGRKISAKVVSKEAAQKVIWHDRYKKLSQ